MDAWWRELQELREEQRDVIALPPEGSFLVNGPPGSGKTNLLLLRANYLANTEHSNLA
jgi:superfamily I DNA/RNA helicase